MAPGARNYQPVDHNAYQGGQHLQEVMHSVKRMRQFTPRDPTFSYFWVPQEHKNDHEGKGASVSVVLQKKGTIEDC